MLFVAVPSSLDAMWWCKNTKTKNNSYENPVLYGSLILTASTFSPLRSVAMLFPSVAFSVLMLSTKNNLSLCYFYAVLLHFLFAFFPCQKFCVFSTTKNVYKQFHVAILFNLIFIYFFPLPSPSYFQNERTNNEKYCSLCVALSHESTYKNGRRRKIENWTVKATSFV